MAAQKVNPEPVEAPDEDQAFQEELETLEGETQEFKVAGEGALTLLALYASKRSYIHWAYKTLNQENLAQNLLNPQTYQEIRRAHKYSNLLLKEKGRWRMEKEGIKKRSHALAIAGVVHRRINTTETNLKLQSAVRSYGLNEESAQKLSENIRGWLEKNPTGDVNSQIMKETTRLHLVQQGLVDEERVKDDKELKREIKKQSSEKKKELKTWEENLKEEYKTSYKRAREANKEALARAETAISQTLDPQSPAPTYQQTKQGVDHVKETFVDIPAETEIDLAPDEQTTETISNVDEKPETETVSDQDHAGPQTKGAPLEEEIKTSTVPESLPKDVSAAPSQLSSPSSPSTFEQKKAVEKAPPQKESIESIESIPKTFPPAKITAAKAPEVLPVKKAEDIGFALLKDKLMPFRTRISPAPILTPSLVGKHLPSGISGLLSSIKAGASRLSLGAGSFLKNEILKRGLSQAVASIVPGVGNAAVLALSAFNRFTKAILGVEFFTAKKVAIFVVGVVLIPVFILSLGLVGLSKIITSYSAREAMTLTQRPNVSLGWQEFEQKYLVSGQKEPSFSFDWKAFEEKLLTSNAK